MTEPIFWLGCSLLLVAVKFNGGFHRRFTCSARVSPGSPQCRKIIRYPPSGISPTLEAIRLTGAEISELTENIDEGVKSTRQVVQGVDRSLGSAKAGLSKLDRGGRRLLIGFKVAWNTWKRS
jgi:hypothetical protein